MSRNLTPELVDRVGRRFAKSCRMVTIYFDDGVLRRTTFAHDLDWDGFTWISYPDLLGVGAIVEDTNLEIAPFTVTLSGVDQTQLALALQTNYVDRICEVWLAYPDEEGRLTADNPPIALARGLTDTPTIEDTPGGLTALNLTVTSPYGDIDGKNGRQTNDQVQQAVFPGDRFFDLVSQTPRRLIWGA